MTTPLTMLDAHHRCSSIDTTHAQRVSPLSEMASSSKILITPGDRPVYSLPKLDAAVAQQVTTLLQESQ